MHKLAQGWEKSELEALNVPALDLGRLNNLIRNIDNNLNAPHHSPLDARKLRELKGYFEKELRKRGV